MPTKKRVSKIRPASKKSLDAALAAIEAEEQRGLAAVADALRPVCEAVARDPRHFDSDAREIRVAGYERSIRVALSGLVSLLPGADNENLSGDAWKAFQVAEQALRWFRDVTVYGNAAHELERAHTEESRELLHRAHHIACDTALTKTEAQIQALHDLDHIINAPHFAWLSEHAPAVFGVYVVDMMCRWRWPEARPLSFEGPVPEDVALLAHRTARAWKKKNGRPSKWSLANELLIALGNGSTPGALRHAWTKRDRKRYRPPARPRLAEAADPAAFWRAVLRDDPSWREREKRSW